MAAQGLLGLKYPEEYGGQGGDYLHEAVLCEEMAHTGSGGTAAGIGAHINIATPPIWKFGTDEQKHRYLVPSIAGEVIGALGITEPGAGSDVAGLSTRADRVDGGFLVNGEKTYITNGVRADFIVTAVKTTPEGGHGGISFRSWTAVRGSPPRSSRSSGGTPPTPPRSPTRTCSCRRRTCSESYNGGFKLIMANFQWERLAMALGAVGAMRLAWERTAAFARERRTFGRPLSEHQAIRHKLADLATTVYTCRCVTYDALRRFVAGEDPLKEVTMAKLATQRASFELMDECLQIHGGAGYMQEYWVERAARDARLGPIGGGSDEIMREILGRTLSL